MRVWINVVAKFATAVAITFLTAKVAVLVIIANRVTIIVQFVLVILTS